MENIIFDSHVHTKYSFDSTEEPENYILKAIEKGYQEITFTDHNDLFDSSLKTAKLDWHHEYEIPVYTTEHYQEQAEEIRKLNEKYKGKILIKQGVELGLNIKCLNYLDTMDQRPYDFVLGSIHNPWNLHVDTIFQQTPFEVHKMYFTTMRDCMASMITAIDVVAHFDFIIRYGPTDAYKILDFPKFKDLIAEILEIIIKNGKGIELNTKLMTTTNRKHPHPMPQILNLYKDLGGEILTYGSDSHTIDQFADNNRKLTIDYAKAHGFHSLCTYSNHQPTHHKL